MLSLLVAKILKRMGVEAQRGNLSPDKPLAPKKPIKPAVVAMQAGVAVAIAAGACKAFEGLKTAFPPQGESNAGGGKPPAITPAHKETVAALSTPTPEPSSYSVASPTPAIDLKPSKTPKITVTWTPTGTEVSVVSPTSSEVGQTGCLDKQAEAQVRQKFLSKYSYSSLPEAMDAFVNRYGGGQQAYGNKTGKFVSSMFLEHTLLLGHYSSSFEKEGRPVTALCGVFANPSWPEQPFSLVLAAQIGDTWSGVAFETAKAQPISELTVAREGTSKRLDNTTEAGAIEWLDAYVGRKVSVAINIAIDPNTFDNYPQFSKSDAAPNRSIIRELAAESYMTQLYATPQLIPEIVTDKNHPFQPFSPSVIEDKLPDLNDQTGLMGYLVFNSQD